MQRQRSWYKEGLFALALAGVLSLGQVALPSLALAEGTDDNVVAAPADQNNNDTPNDNLTTPNETINETPAAPAETPAAPAETPAAPAETPAAPANEMPTVEPSTETLTTPATEQPSEQLTTPADETNNTTPSEDVVENDTTPGTDEPTVADPEYNDPVENGTVAFIESGASGNETQVLDAKGGKSANGTNIQTYKLNNTAAQKYEFEKAMRAVIDAITGEAVIDGETGEVMYEEDRDESGNIFYWIKRSGTEQVLTVVGNLGTKGANVALYAKNPSLDGQKWLVSDMGNGLYKISSKLTTSDNKELVLDIANGKKANGANIQVWTSNNSQAQRFSLINTKVPASTAAIESGVYTVSAKGNTGLVADVASGSIANGANLRLYKSNSTPAQSMVITSDGAGYYTIGILKSGKVFDVEGGSMLPGANVRQWNYNGSDAQKWSIQQNADGSYSFINKKNGLYLNIENGTLSSGTNLRVFRPMGNNAAQKFALTRNTKADKNVLGVGDEVSATGIYTISPVANTSFVFDVKSGSKNPGGLIQLWASNGTQAQKFQVELVGDNLYRIRTGASGDYLTDMGAGAQLQQGEGTTWTIFWDNAGYFAFKNTDSGNVFEVKGASYAKGTAIRSAASTSKANQHFIFTPATLITEGCYYITLDSGNTLDIANGSTAAGANVRIWSLNKSEAQRFNIVKVGNYYQLVNMKSGKAVAGGGAYDGTYHNVLQQNRSTTNKTQLWKVVVGNDGFIEFVNVASKKNLFSRGTDKSSNVVEKKLYGEGKSHLDNIHGRSWKLVLATGWYKKNGHWYYTSDDSRAHFDMDCDSKGKSTGNYDILYTIWRYVNGKISGSNKCFYSKTGYLICSSWDNCYLAIFKGKAKVTVADNWQPLFGLNIANGQASKIEAQNRVNNPGSKWKWDPNWDRNLSEGNANIKNLPQGSEWAYKLDYKPGQSNAKGSYNWTHSRKEKVNSGERWFTSVSTTLGYHTFLGGDSKASSQMGRHISYGCQRLLTKYAKWIYDNIAPGTRCMQRTNKKMLGKK